MAGLNKQLIIGFLGKDPELKYTQTGMAVCKFSVAVTETFKQTSTTEWFSCVAFNKTAEICSQYLAKGRQVYIEGRTKTNSWTDKDGNKRDTKEVIVDSMQMLGANPKASNNNYQSKPAPAPVQKPQESYSSEIGYDSPIPNSDDDDIPF